MSDMDKKELVKLISFMATFDGGLYLPSRKDRDASKHNAQFIMNMRKENLDYVEWVASILSGVTGVSIKDRQDYNTDGFVRQEQVRLESNRHPLLTTIRNRLYVQGRKVLDPHMLKLLDAEALAIIYMADGGYRLDKGLYPSVHLHTKGFSGIENMALSKAIYEKFGVRSNVNRQNQFSYLRIKSKDVDTFLEIVAPYVLPSFHYKLGRFAPTTSGGDIVCSTQECVGVK